MNALQICSASFEKSQLEGSESNVTTRWTHRRKGIACKGTAWSSLIQQRNLQWTANISNIFSFLSELSEKV